MLNPKVIAGGGWLEVLFQREPREFRRFSELLADDYVLVGRVPIREVDRPYDVYRMLHAGCDLFAATRRVAHGDIINLCINNPRDDVRTYVLAEPARAIKALQGGHYRIDILPDYPLGMILLPQRFRSFCAPTSPR